MIKSVILPGVTYSSSVSNITETNFKVKSLVAGLKFSKFALDYIKFNFESDKLAIQETEVTIYNLSYFYTKWIFTYGRRFESSFKEAYENSTFITLKDKSDTFLGIQYATKRWNFTGCIYKLLSLWRTKSWSHLFFSK